MKQRIIAKLCQFEVANKWKLNKQTLKPECLKRFSSYIIYFKRNDLKTNTTKKANFGSLKNRLFYGCGYLLKPLLQRKNFKISDQETHRKILRFVFHWRIRVKEALTWHRMTDSIRRFFLIRQQLTDISASKFWPRTTTEQRLQ